MARKISYGILGCGKHALQSHALPGKHTALELAALHDLSDTNMKSFEQSVALSVQKYTDRDAFLASDIQAVLISTPDECHFADLSDVVEAGKHVFIEKPLATRIEEMEPLRAPAQWPRTLPWQLRIANANRLTSRRAPRQSLPRPPSSQKPTRERLDATHLNFRDGL